MTKIQQYFTPYGVIPHLTLYVRAEIFICLNWIERDSLVKWQEFEFWLTSSNKRPRYMFNFLIFPLVALGTLLIPVHLWKSLRGSCLIYIQKSQREIEILRGIIKIIRPNNFGLSYSNINSDAFWEYSTTWNFFTV